MRAINRIIIHCSASSYGNVDVIDQWHRIRGFNGIGYHYCILNGVGENLLDKNPENNGVVEFGRPIERQGAHCKGHNEDSIGVCLIGVDSFTIEQMNALKALCVSLMKDYNIPPENIHGHNEFSTKSCPNFDVQAWVKTTLIKPNDLIARVEVLEDKMNTIINAINTLRPLVEEYHG